MKRIIYLFLVLTACCVLFAACGGTGAQQSAETPVSAEVEATEAPAPAEEPAATEVPVPAEEPAATEAPVPAEADAAEAPAEAAEEPSAEEPETEGAVLPDGVYQVDFDTDSSMFHINEAHKGKGVLTVRDGEMTVHITLASRKITLLYSGLAADAKAADPHNEPTVDTVTYDDGDTGEAYGFDLPVPYLDEEFPCAILGSKSNWYDHMVSVSNPVPMEEVG